MRFGNDRSRSAERGVGVREVGGVRWGPGQMMEHERAHTNRHTVTKMESQGTLT